MHVFRTLMNPHHRELPMDSARRFGGPRRSGFVPNGFPPSFHSMNPAGLHLQGIFSS